MAATLVVAGPAAPASATLLAAPSVVASGLQTPWEVLPLPDGRTLVTELPGRVRVIEADGTLRTTPVYEGNTSTKKFLGMAKSPDYATDRFVYLYVSDGAAANPNASRVDRLFDDGTDLLFDKTIYDQGIKSDGNHDGGRIAFGPDGMLYVTTGDIHDPSLPRDRTSANGKILRMDPEGAAPADNPFDEGGASRYVWSYGHRHPQGIGWDAQGRMWESEHGPSGEAHAPAGAKTGNDEINRIVMGGDYGWPTVAGDQTAPGVITPVAHAANFPAWAPGGLAFGSDGLMYVPFLAGTELRAFSTSGDSITGRTSLLRNAYGRLRAAVADGSNLWLTTSNNSSNEKVMRVPVGLLPPTPALVGQDAAAAAAPATPARVAPPPSVKQIRKLLDAVLTRQAAALRRRTVAQLLKARRLRLRDRVLPAKRLSLELRLGRQRLGYGTAATGTGRATAVWLTLGRKARASLARQRRAPRLKLIARLRAADGRLVTRAIALTPKAAG